MSQRQKQIEALLQRTVAAVLQRGLADPRIKGLISVTHVVVSNDLKHASVYVSVVPEKYESRTIHGLKDATMHIQWQVKKAVALRVVPHIEFKLDQGLKKQAEVFAAIEEGMKRTAETESLRHDQDPDAAPQTQDPEAASHQDAPPNNTPDTPRNSLGSTPGNTASDLTPDHSTPTPQES